jgi:hypothetical protein
MHEGVICEPAQVVTHLPENWTRILLVRTFGLGLADGGAYWDIPTEAIPEGLRAIGSRFVIIQKMPYLQNPPRHGREVILKSIRIEELPEADRALWPEYNLPSKNASQ